MHSLVQRTCATIKDLALDLLQHLYRCNKAMPGQIAPWHLQPGLCAGWWQNLERRRARAPRARMRRWRNPRLDQREKGANSFDNRCGKVPREPEPYASKPHPVLPRKINAAVNPEIAGVAVPGRRY